MSEPTACDRARPRFQSSCYCSGCDLLVGIPGFHVIDVSEHAGVVRVVVESAPGPVGCSLCGVVARSHGRRDVSLIDVPCFGRPVRLIWRKRTWRCSEGTCPGRWFARRSTRRTESAPYKRWLMSKAEGLKVSAAAPARRLPVSGTVCRAWPAGLRRSDSPTAGAAGSR